jgi:hypothetical protein
MCDEMSDDSPQIRVWSREALDHLKDRLPALPDQLGQLLLIEEDRPAFDPIAVRNNLREMRADGMEPELLVLGRLEMASFRHFVSRGFGEESGSPYGGLFFLGIPVVEDVSPTRLEFVIDEDSTTNGPPGQNAA